MGTDLQGGFHRPQSEDNTLLTRYRRLKRIGAGGMAEVYLARPKGETDRLVALKQFLPEIVRDEEVLGILFDEAERARALRHPNICAIIELGHLRKAHVIVSELAPLRDLERLIASLAEPIPIAAALQIALQIGEALCYAHGLAIVHGNLVPTNVRLDNEGQVRLTDFCIGRAAHFLLEGKTRILKRRFGYMSPEQVRGHVAEPRSDLFALGSLLYELLTGEQAFRAKNELATLDRVRRGSLINPSAIRADLPQDLENLVLKALKSDPDDRWSSAAEVTDVLRGCLDQVAPSFGRVELGAWAKNRSRITHRRSSHPPFLA